MAMGVQQTSDFSVAVEGGIINNQRGFLVQIGDEIVHNPPVKNFGIDGAVELGRSDEFAVDAGTNRVGAAFGAPVDQPVGTLAYTGAYPTPKHDPESAHCRAGQ